MFEESARNYISFKFATHHITQLFLGSIVDWLRNNVPSNISISQIAA